MVRQASNTIAVTDRLARLGVAPAEQAGIYLPADFTPMWPDPTKTEPTQDTVSMVGRDMLAFGMTILIFMIIIMYGNWIAMSVVEEKSSRVMEVVLNAASPFQLLTGKVLGVGAVAFTQYAAVVLAGVVALLVQGPVADTILGTAGTATELPEGLTIGLLLFFGIYGVLGFLIYAIAVRRRRIAGEPDGGHQRSRHADDPRVHGRLSHRRLRGDGPPRHPVRAG